MSNLVKLSLLKWAKGGNNRHFAVKSNFNLFFESEFDYLFSIAGWVVLFLKAAGNDSFFSKLLEKFVFLNEFTLKSTNYKNCANLISIKSIREIRGQRLFRAGS